MKNQIISICDNNNAEMEVTLREIASWRDSLIVDAKPCDNSIDLMKLVNDYRSKAKEIKLPVNTTLDEAIKLLKNKQIEGIQDYKVNFNGTWLYSININETDAYMAVTGMTRMECIKREQIERYSLELRLEAEKKDAETNLQNRIDQGKEVIVEGKWSSWEELVETLSNPPYYVHALNTIIKYIKLLNNQSLSVMEIANMFHEEFGNETGDWYTSTILTHVARFSPRGTELFRSAANISKSKGRKVASNKEYLDNIDRANHLVTMGISFEEAETLAKKEMYNVRIGLELNLQLINTEENLYEGISNTNKYCLVTRIGDYFITYLFSENSYTRYINHIYLPNTLISTNEKPIVRSVPAKITGMKMRKLIKNKAKLFKQVEEARKTTTPGLILQAYKEISDLAKEQESNQINSQVIDCVVDINQKKIIKQL